MTALAGFRMSSNKLNDERNVMPEESATSFFVTDEPQSKPGAIHECLLRTVLTNRVQHFHPHDMFSKSSVISTRAFANTTRVRWRRLLAQANNYALCASHVRLVRSLNAFGSRVRRSDRECSGSPCPLPRSESRFSKRIWLRESSRRFPRSRNLPRKTIVRPWEARCVFWAAKTRHCRSQKQGPRNSGNGRRSERRTMSERVSSGSYSFRKPCFGGPPSETSVAKGKQV